MIDLLPAAPLRSQGPTAFDATAEPFVAALPPMVVQINAATAAITASEAAAAASAAAALNSQVVSAQASYKGLWTALTGALNMPASVYHAGAYWALNTNLANVTTAVPGVSASWQKIKTAPDVVAYASRASIRGLAPGAGDFVEVVGLGMFAWFAGSALQDDDETVFTTSGGQWLLVNADPELAFVALRAEVDEALEDADTAQATADTAQATADTAQATAGTAQAAINALSGKFLRGSFSMSLTSLATVTSGGFTATVTGAAVGDSVIVNPGDAFGTTAANQGRLSYVAYVSAANTVTVTIRNASASTASMTASTWQVLVIKQ